MIGASALIPLDIRFRTTTFSFAEKQPAPILIALDVSLSMSATDITPTRFQAATQLLENVVADLPEWPIGIIVFAGVPWEIIPLTDQRQALLQRIHSLSLTEFPVTQGFLGTAMGDALLLARRKLVEHGGTILLVSDGDPSKGVDTMQVADLLARDGIPVYTLIVGSGSVVLGYDLQGDPIYAQTSPTTMQAVAARTMGNSRTWTTASQWTALATALIRPLSQPLWSVSRMAIAHLLSLRICFWSIVLLGSKSYAIRKLYHGLHRR